MENHALGAADGKGEAPVGRQAGRPLHHAGGRDAVLDTQVDHGGRDARDALRRAGPHSALAVGRETADAVVRQSLHPLAGVAAAAFRRLRAEAEQPVLRAYPQTAVGGLQHTVVFGGPVLYVLRRGEGGQRVGLRVEHEDAVLGVDDGPLRVDGACADEAAVVVERGQLGVERGERAALGVEVAQRGELDAQQVAMVGQLADEGGAVGRQAGHVARVVEGECAAVADFHAAGLAAPDAALTVLRAAGNADEGMAAAELSDDGPMGRQVDDAVVAGAYPEAALAVLRHRGIARRQSERVDGPPLSGVGHVAQHLAPGKALEGVVGRQPPGDVVAEGASARVEEVDAIEVVEPQQRVALPQPSVGVGMVRHAVGVSIVAGQQVEAAAVGDAEDALAVDEHLAVGQLHDLLHLARR